MEPACSMTWSTLRTCQFLTQGSLSPSCLVDFVLPRAPYAFSRAISLLTLVCQCNHCWICRSQSVWQSVSQSIAAIHSLRILVCQLILINHQIIRPYIEACLVASEWLPERKRWRFLVVTWPTKVVAVVVKFAATI